MNKIKRTYRFIFTFASLFILLALCIVVNNLFEHSKLEKIQKEAIEQVDKYKGEYNTNSIVLKNTSREEAESLAIKLNASLRITQDASFATLTLSDEVTVEDIFKNEEYIDIIDKLSLDFYAKPADLEETQEDVLKPSKPNYNVTDPLYSYQSYLDYINLGNVWNSYKGSGLTIAIIDTGIDTDHPEFTGRISEYSYNATEDKIVKDYKNADGSYDWSLIEDEQGHGTSVSGVVASSMNNIGTVGIAPLVNLLIIKAECNENGVFLRTSDLVFGLYYAIERRVNVVNMSFGTFNNPFSEALRLAKDSDIFCVAAAGNESSSMLTYPAADPNALGVGALDANSFQLADYSNFGDNSDLVAPGTVYTCAIGGGYKTISGTSFSSPIVASAIILMKGSYKDRYKENDEIKELLFASCVDLGALGDDFYYGYGALDVSALILEERGIVTFDMLTDELEDIEQTFIRHHTLQNLPEPQRLYSVFDGWYYDIHCTEEVNWYQDVWTSDLTLYAKWANEDDSVPYTYVVLADGTVEISSYTGKRRYITIPDKIEGRVVSSIADFCFSGNQRLREVNLPKGLKNIGLKAFENCSNLLSIHIPKNVEIIKDYTFANCSRLYEVSFENDSKLQYIGDFAFSNTSLERFEIKRNVYYVNGSAFFGCTNLSNYTVEKGNESFKTISGVLYNKTESEIVAYPAAKKDDTYSLKDITKTIGIYAFSFSKLKTINLNKVENIKDYSFAYSKLIEVIIPDTVKNVGKCSFYYAEYLSSITLGKGMKSIEEGTFGCTTSLLSIYIPNNIEIIKDSKYLCGAFKSSGLKNVVFEEDSKLYYIGSSAFEECPIETITIPNSVVTIGASAFLKTELINVNFEENSNLQTIGNYAFSECIYLSKIIFPDNINYIGFKSFEKTGLTGNIIIPKNVSTLGEGVFSGCNNLENIYVDTLNKVYKDVDGVVYTKDGTIITHYPSGKNLTSYNIVKNTLEVGDYAFSSSNKLNDVTFPSTLHTIGEYAFEYCLKVSFYYLPESLVTVKRNAFTFNTSLYSISIPDNVMQISNYAFSYCNKLNNVTFTENAKLPRISFASFAHCGITSIKIPKNVSTISQYAFEGCNNLTSVVFAKGSKLDYVPAYMFKGANNIKTITFESGSSLTSISAHGFEGMSRLKSIDFGDAKLTNIDNYAFRYCENLTNITIPEGVDYIGRFAFYGCKSLTELTLPTTIERIGRNAFYFAENLNVYFKTSTLPKGLQENWDLGIRGYYVGVTKVETLGDYKYAKLTNGGTSIIEYLGNKSSIDLTNIGISDIRQIGGYAFANKKITSITLPNTLKEIHRYAFSNTDLNSITIPNSVEMIARNAFDMSKITSVLFEDNINLYKLEQYAFANTTKLENITIPRSIKELGSYVFFNSGIKNVTFEEGINIEKIPSYLFLGSNLTSVIIPNTVNYIDDSAFRDCKNLESVVLSNAPDLQIDANAFYNTALTKVNIGPNVKYIGEYAFIGLRNLSNYEVDSNNPYYKSIDGVLYSKDGKKLIAFPAKRTGEFIVPKEVETIGFGAFENTNLSKVTFEEGINLLTLGYRAFYNAKNLKEITIPKTVVSIDYYAFGECRNLESVCFEDGNRLTGVYEGAFINCVKLTNIILPDTIKEISDYAFYGCISLNKLPVNETNDLKGIYSYAFAYSGIKELNLPKSLIDIGEYAFMGLKIKTLEISNDNQEELVIGIGALRDCNELEEITLPFIGASLDDQKLYWFGYIFGAGSYNANKIYIPKSLKEVYVNGDMTRIGYNAFYSTKCLVLFDKQLEYHNSDGIYFNIYFNVESMIKNDIYKYMTVNDNSAYILEYIGNEEHVDFSYVDGYKIINTSLRNLFKENKKLKSIIIGNEVTSIANDTFSGCTSLSNIIFEENSKLTNIDARTFYNYTNLTSITIPDNVSSIGEWAFYGCSKLENVYYNGTIEDWCNIIFEEQLSNPMNNAEHFFIKNEQGEYEEVTNIVIPDTITQIGKYQFYGFDYITNITIPGSVTRIGGFAFSGCRRLTSIEILEGVTSIDSQAFSDCAYLTSITIPKSITSISGLAFSNCYNLMLVCNNSDLNIEIGSFSHGFIAYYAKILIDKNGTNTIEDDKTYYLTDEKFLFEYSNTTYKLIGYLGNEETVRIPDNFNGNKYSLYYVKGITNLIVPSSFKTINRNAFYASKGLKTVTFEENSNVTSIEKDAFSSCGSLTSIEIPESVTTIDNNAFSNCPNLKITINSNNNSFTEINNIVYNKKVTEIIFIPNSVKNIIIPNTITNINLLGNQIIETVKFEENSKLRYIGPYAFENCTSLTSIEIPEGVTSIGTSAFSCCASLTSIKIPKTVTKIESSAFGYCSSLTSIIIPDSVRSIGNDAFSSCSSLTSITIPKSVTSIGGGAFINCYSLTSITIPNGVTSIGASTFNDCRSLTSISFEENSKLTSIGELAFAYCASLTSIEIPENVSRIESKAFLSCPRLQITIDSNNINFIMIDNVIYNEDITEIIFVSNYVKNIIIPNTVTNIYFNSNRTIESIKFEKGSKLTSIEYNAFSSCTNLSSIEIPESVTSIGSSAFFYCDSLKSIKIPESVTSIGRNAFNGCSSLMMVYNNSDLNIEIGSTSYGNVAYYAEVLIDKNGIHTKEADDLFYLTEDKFLFKYSDNTYNLIEYLGNEETIRLPDDFNGNKYNLYYTRGIINVIIPSNFKTINSNAFYCSKELKTVTFEENSKLTTIENGAFSGCSSLDSIVIPSGVTSIGDDAFRGCINMHDITIPESVTSIGSSAFYNCTSLTNIVIPESLTSIENDTFNNCSSLTSIEIPNNVTSIGENAFYNCTNLSSIIYNGNLQKLYSSSFINTAYYNDESNWDNGIFYFYNYPIDIEDKNIKELILKEYSIILINSYFITNTKKFLYSFYITNCYSLEYVSSPYFNDLFNLSNIKTIKLDSLPRDILIFENQDKSIFIENESLMFDMQSKPLTLKNVILSNNCDVMSSKLFKGITDINIFVEHPETAVMWDHDYPGWNNGNKVYYAGEWSEAVFRDSNGEIITRDYYVNNQVIRQPYVKDIVDGTKKYIFQGWDLDGDGIIDPVPATSAINIDAKAVMKEVDNDFRVTFYDYDDNIYFEESYLYDDTLILPTAPTKKGYIFLGWSRYEEGMKVTSNIMFHSSWKHIGDGHSYNITHIDNNCNHNGYDEYICTICDHTYKANYLDKLPHLYGEWIIDVEKDCNTDGLKHRICTECNYVENEVTHKEGHMFEMIGQEDSTCCETGYRIYQCTECKIYLDEKLPLSQHEYEKKYANITWIEWLINSLVNIVYGCEGERVFYYSCKHCDDIMTINQHGSSTQINNECSHILADYKIEKILDDTEGYKVRYCTKCQKAIEAKIISTHIHSFGLPTYEWLYDNTKVKATRVCSHDSSHIETETVNVNITITQKQTCENVEVVTYVAQFTNKAFTIQTKANVQTKDALGHNYVWIVDVEATEETVGYKHQECTVCHKRINENMVIDKLEHKHNLTFVNKVNSTCNDNGNVAYYYCSKCGKYYSDSNGLLEITNIIINPLGHSYNNPTYEWLDNNTKIKATRVCSHDSSHIETETVNVNITITQKQTCVDVELTTYTSNVFTNKAFSVQTKANVKTKDALGHSYNNPTYEWLDNNTKVKATRVCSHDSSHIETETVNVNITITQKQTCDNVEFTTYVAQFTNKSFIDQSKANVQTKDALGHDYSDWIVTKEPTIDEDGIKTKTCTHCHDQIKEVIKFNAKEQFVNAVTKIDVEKMTITELYEAINEAIKYYQYLTDEVEVQEEVEKLELAIDSYNILVQTINEAQNNIATKAISLICIIMSISLVATILIHPRWKRG